MKFDEVSKELYGPILELTMKDLVNGVPKYGHVFKNILIINFTKFVQRQKKARHYTEFLK